MRALPLHAAHAHVAVTPGTAVPAVLLSPLLSTVGVVLYERWQGSPANLNLWKCSLASLLFAGVAMSTARSPLSAMLEVASLSHVAARMLVLSSFLGIVVGDLLWLRALQLLGARMTILQATLQPLLAALAGAIFLGQPLAPSTGIAIAAVCSGLALAQASPAEAPPPAKIEGDAESSRALVGDGPAGAEAAGGPHAHATSQQRLLLGSALNLLNLALDTTGSVLTRRHGLTLTTWQLNFVRFGAGALMTLLGLVAVHAWSALARPHAPPPEWAALVPTQPAKSWVAAGCGCVCTTFLASALANYALFGLPLGIWSAMTSLGPVWSIPVLYLLRREVTSVRGVLGAALAVCGAAACSMAARVG